MKILHLIYDDIKNPWCGGGGAVRTFEIYKRLAKRHDITVVCGIYPGALRDEIIEGVRYIRVGSYKNYLISVLSYSWVLLFFRMRGNFDLIIKDFSPYTPMYTLRMKINGCIALYQNYIGFLHIIKDHPLLGVFPFLFEKFSIKRFNHFIASSNCVADDLHKRIKKRSSIISVFPYGVSDEFFRITPEDGDYILYLGRFDIFQKGLDVLAEAFAEVVKKYPQQMLVIAGGGKDEIKLKSILKSKNLEFNVKFAGRVFGDKKIQLLAKSLFVCRPSRFESFALGALEASAAGKVVVCSRIAGNCEVIKEGETGIMYDFENAGQLKMAMINLIEDEEKRKMLGRKARKHAGNFTWGKIADGQEVFYEKIASQKE